MQNRLWSKEFTALILSTLLMAWAFYALLPTLPIYLIRELKVSQKDIGLVMAIFSISAILIRPISGHLLDNYHRFLVLILSLFLMTAGYGVYPLAKGVAAMLLLRFMHGAMWGICSSATATMVADTVPPAKLGEGIGIFALCIPVGMTIGPMFGLEILKGYGAGTMFFTILCISFLGLLVAFFAKAPFKITAGRKFSVKNLFHKKALSLSLCMFFVMIAYGAIVIFVGIYAAQRGFSNVTAFFLCFSVAIFLSRLFLGKLFDRGYVFQLILAGLVLTTVGMPWLGYARYPTQFLVAGVINGFGFGILLPTCQAAINNLVNSGERGAANSTYLISYDLGVGVGSLLIGFLSDKVPLGTIYACSSSVILLSAAMFVLIAIPHYHRNNIKNDVALK